MKIKSSAPRGKDMRDAVRSMTLTAEDEAEQKLLSRLHWRMIDQGSHRTLAEGLGIEAPAPAEARGSEVGP